MLTHYSFLSFYSLFVNLMPFPLIISLISCNSFFSLFVSLQDRAGSIVQNHVLRGQFSSVLAFRIPALFRRASIPVVPTGYSGSWRVTAVPSTPERAKP